jgi:hypothetical protein
MNQKFKALEIAVILLIAAIALSQNAGALGVVPGSSSIDYTPGQSMSGKVKILNTENKDFKAVISADGKLKDYIKFSKNSLEFNSGEKEKEMSYVVALPDGFNKPGLHNIEIVIREVSLEKGREEIVINPLLSVVSEVNIKVPFPGKYADGTIKIKSDSKNGNVDFYISVSNLGVEPIQKAQGFISIYDLNNNLINLINTGSISIEKAKRKELASSWSAGPNLGKYIAYSSIEYDDKNFTIEKSFLVGDFFIIPLDIAVDNFELGRINKFNILVENDANQPINDLTAELYLDDEQDNNIASLKSAVQEVGPHSVKEFFIFWDTKDLKEGNYKGHLKLKYSDLESKYKIAVKVEKNRVEIFSSWITGRVVDSSPADSGSELSLLKENWIKIGIALLLLINLAKLVHYLIKRNKKKNN